MPSTVFHGLADELEQLVARLREHADNLGVGREDKVVVGDPPPAVVVEAEPVPDPNPPAADAAS